MADESPAEIPPLARTIYFRDTANFSEGGLAKPASKLFLWLMRVSDERAQWLARNVFPHEPAIRAWLRHRLTLGIEIDDVIHDMYAKLVALPTIDQIESPRRYAFRIAYTIVIDHVRQVRSNPQVEGLDIEKIDVIEPWPSVEEQLQQRGELRTVSAVIDTLPPLCRQAFLLRRLEGLSQRETAAKLGISEKTVEKYMTRSVKLIMEVFGRGGKSNPAPSYMTGKQQLRQIGKRDET